MKQVFLYIISLIVRFIPIKQNVILFESYPELGGSPWMIYQELIKRGYDKKYKLIWAIESSIGPSPDIRSIPFFGKGFKHYIDKFLYIISAKVIIDSNIYIPKIHPKTFRLYTQHGAPLKNWKFYSKRLGKLTPYYLYQRQQRLLTRFFSLMLRDVFSFLGIHQMTSFF